MRGPAARAVVRELADHEPVLGAAELQKIADIVAGARVWCFGEATHGVHEYLVLRNRLLVFAVERLGFTAIAVETNLSDAEIVDDYVLGLRPFGEEVARAVFSANEYFRWSEGAFEENLRLIRWIREHNSKARTQRPVRFYGIDVGWSTAAPPEWDGAGQVNAALEFVGSLDRTLEARLRASVAPYLSRFNSEDRFSLTLQEREALSMGLAGLLNVLDRGAPRWAREGSGRSFGRARRHAQVARLLDPSELPARAEMSMDAPGGERDLVMAESVRWILEQEGIGGRVFVFASDVHVRRGRWSYVDPTWGRHRSMGERLDANIGEQMVVLGSVHRRGRATGVGGTLVEQPPADDQSVAGVLAMEGSQLAVIDLRPGGRSRQLPEGLGTPLPLRVKAGEPDEPWLTATECFDAMLWVDVISPIRPMPREG